MRFLRTDTSCRVDHLRARAAAEIAFVTLCVLIAEWGVIPIFGRRKSIGIILILMVFLFGFLSHRVRGETAREIGFTGRNFGSAFRLLVMWMVPAAGTLLGVGWLVGSLHFNPPRDWAILVQRQLWLFLWALMQQYALQAIVNRRAQEIWGRGAPSIAAAALLFAALHLPNLWLMAATLAGGLLWAAVYQKHPNLYALAFSHSLMTTVFASSTSPDVLHSLRVGYNYF
jgi:membrane protease YdiL (CAAX protease family)